MDLQDIHKHLLVAEEQIEKLKGGRKIAATHSRASLLAIKKEADRIRKEIMVFVKDLPIKEKKVKTPSIDPEPKEEPEPTEPEPPKKKVVKRKKVAKEKV